MLYFNFKSGRKENIPQLPNLFLTLGCCDFARLVTVNFYYSDKFIFCVLGKSVDRTTLLLLLPPRHRQRSGQPFASSSTTG
jgi:hypothetical protein